MRRLRDRELATTEPVRSGDKGAGVVAGVRARKDRDPALYLRILARGIDRLRIVFTPRAQDDQIVAQANRNGSAASGASLRRRLVAELESAGCLTGPSVRQAFLTVPREHFVPEALAREGLDAIYQNRVFVTRRDERGAYTSSSSQPSIMAAMLERLEVRRGQRVLEVGAGTGYNAALLAKLVGSQGRVVSIDLEPETARAARQALVAVKRVEVIEGDGQQGWPPGAPYDRIIVTASASAVAPAWFEQLADDGRLEVPLKIDPGGNTQAIVTFEKHAGGLRSVAVLCGGFMSLRDFAGARVPAPAPQLSAHERVGEQFRSLAYLSGQPLQRLSSKRRRRLLSLALTEPRVHRLGVRAARGPLALYLALQAPKRRFVGGWMNPGVISADGGGVAHLAGGKTFNRIEAYGAAEPERELRDLIEDWKRRGRPTERDLRVEVSFDPAGSPSIDWNWTR